RTLSVFHVDRSTIEATIDMVLAEIGVPAIRSGNVWSGDRPVLSIDSFSGLRHVSIRFLSTDPRVCEELERGLREKLALAPPSAAPFAFLLSSAAIASFAAVICTSLLVVVYVRALAAR